MKKLFLLIVMMNISFAGREFYSFDPKTKLYEIKMRVSQIRMRLGYRLNLEEVVRLSEQERNEQYEKFNQLWQEFVAIKSILQKQLTSYNDKMALIMTAILLRNDKDRYERERRADSNLARMFARVTLSQTEVLTQ